MLARAHLLAAVIGASCSRADMLPPPPPLPTAAEIAAARRLVDDERLRWIGYGAWAFVLGAAAAHSVRRRR
jgi:hypothetical protein